MKTTSKKLVCILLSLLLVGQVVIMLAACDKKLDPETSPLVLSTDALDGVFNPFSYTSGADGGVVGQTQLGMLNIDEKGDIVAGWDQPSVAEAYSVVTKGTEADYDKDGDYSNYYTDYYFVIKNGIKFSDGTDLTIKDVLFNLYVYLDPVYTGSSTMYSIDIQGLSRYRTQSADDNAQENTNEQAQSQGYQRVQRLLGWCELKNETSLEDYFSATELVEVRSDLEKIQALFKDELNADWVSAAAMVEDFSKYYLQNAETDAIVGATPAAVNAWKNYTKEDNKNRHITEQWEAFAIMYGLITTKTEQLGDRESGNAIKKYTYEYNGSDKFNHDQESMVNRAYLDFFPSDESGTKFKEQLKLVLTQYATSGTFFEYAVNSEMEKILKANGETLQFNHIDGIKVYEANSIPSSSVSSGATTFDNNRTILNIRINGVDPKAIYSFSFTVAPMEYYSTSAAMANFKELDSDAVYSEPTVTVEGQEYPVKKYVGFGVDFASTDFMGEVNSRLVPRGAGPYRPSDGSSKGVDDKATVSRGQFFKNNIVSFERNNYFKTVMKDGHNAYIKFLSYKVIASNAMTEAVTGKRPEVHISQPSATKKEIQKIRQLNGVEYIPVDYMGYGYIGINANFVKNVLVRKAIMHAMNVNLCLDYYGGGEYCSIIYRSMSKNSRYYPETATKQYYEFDATGQTSLDLVKEAGYEVDSKTGLLTNSARETLKFTFTVAGETEDHPAYQTMALAAKILNDIGFDISVTKDSQALSKLASGGLQIWAAAWSSAIDPDMYQVYHKDSSASSVKNWGYSYLKSAENTDGTRQILDDLAEEIELGRKYTDFKDRVDHYHKALNYVMELAVELPTYQRKEMYLINSKIVDVNTLCEANMYQSPISKIWDVNFVGAK